MTAAITARIDEAATAENAARYEATTDRFTFCLDMLGLSLTDNGERVCEWAVNSLEDKFDAITA